VRRSCSGFELGLRGFFKETELTRDIYIVLYRFVSSNSHKKYYGHFTSWFRSRLKELYFLSPGVGFAAVTGYIVEKGAYDSVGSVQGQVGSYEKSARQSVHYPSI
jgi:hypothetical protein